MITTKSPLSGSTDNNNKRPLEAEPCTPPSGPVLTPRLSGASALLDGPVISPKRQKTTHPTSETPTRGAAKKLAKAAEAGIEGRCDADTAVRQLYVDFNDTLFGSPEKQKIIKDELASKSISYSEGKAGRVTGVPGITVDASSASLSAVSVPALVAPPTTELKQFERIVVLPYWGVQLAHLDGAYVFTGLRNRNQNTVFQNRGASDWARTKGKVAPDSVETHEFAHLAVDRVNKYIAEFLTVVILETWYINQDSENMKRVLRDQLALYVPSMTTAEKTTIVDNVVRFLQQDLPKFIDKRVSPRHSDVGTSAKQYSQNERLRNALIVQLTNQLSNTKYNLTGATKPFNTIMMMLEKQIEKYLQRQHHVRLSVKVQSADDDWNEGVCMSYKIEIKDINQTNAPWIVVVDLELTGENAPANLHTMPPVELIAIVDAVVEATAKRNKQKAAERVSLPRVDPCTMFALPTTPVPATSPGEEISVDAASVEASTASTVDPTKKFTL